MPISKTVSFAAFCLALSCLPDVADAEVLDLGTVKCKEFLTSSKEDMGYTLAWLDGFYKDEDAPAIIDFDKLKDNAGKLGGYCAQNPDVGLGTAAEELFGK